MRKSFPLEKPTLYLKNKEIIEYNSHKHLRLVFQLSGEWRLHVQTIVDKSVVFTRLNIDLGHLWKKYIPPIYCLILNMRTLVGITEPYIYFRSFKISNFIL